MHFLAACAVALWAWASAARDAHAWRLTEVHGDGCVPGHVFSRVISEREARTGHYRPGTLAVMHDGCGDDRLTVGVDGIPIVLSRKAPPAGIGSFEGPNYANAEMSVSFRDLGPIVDIPDSAETCGASFRKVAVHIVRRGAGRSFVGTVVRGC